MSRQQRIATLIGGVVLLVAATGCPIIIPPEPDSVLKGTWELNGDVVSPDVTDFLMTFNRHGKLTEISYVFANATVVINSAALVNSSSNVDGNDVTIRASWPFGNTLFFHGTLNAAQTVIDGTTTYRLVIGVFTVEIPTGPATLTKI